MSVVKKSRTERAGVDPSTWPLLLAPGVQWIGKRL
jgi:hypothetical protein